MKVKYFSAFNIFHVCISGRACADDKLMDFINVDVQVVKVLLMSFQSISRLL